MPRRCSVAGCRSNYDGEPQHTSTFSLPKNPELREQWLRRIPTDFSNLKNPVVCIKHFDEKFVIFKDKVFYKGEFKEYDRERPKLTEDAIPTLFQNCPSYLSKELPKVHRLADVEKENLDIAIKESLETYKKYTSEKSLNSLFDVQKYIEKRCLPEKWVNYTESDKLFLCLLKVHENRPYISASITLDVGLNVSVFIQNTLISNKNLPLKTSVVQTTDDLDSIISYVIENSNKTSPECIFQSALETIQSSTQYQESECIQFCLEQIKLTSVHKQSRRYGNKTMTLAACLFIHSPSAYHALLKSDLLFLPHPRNLRKLICNFDLSMSSLSSSASYLEGRIKHLKPDELIVNLILDEIYVQPQLTFKGGEIYGSSMTDSSKIAKTVQVFMISSVFSKYKDVVTLVPVCNLTSDYLKHLILSLITVLEKMGFKILSLISDNNNVNRKAFELMTDNKILQPYISHPHDPSRLLFFIFDTVHILKCVRNNWETKQNENRSIYFPDMQTGNIVQASYRHLELMYELEKSSLLKYGHTLSTKVLYPSNIQKQNVSLALKVFNENNVTALKHIATQHPNIFHSVESTCMFIEIIVKWWKIINVKSSFEGKRFNDTFREPIRKDSYQIEFLKNLCIWLKNWRQSVPINNALTSQTFQALVITTESFLKLIPYIFDTYHMEYILLGKFQSDDLEGRFSSYRQLSGANYYITYMQVLENERKIRFKNTVLFSVKQKNIHLTTLIPLKHNEGESEVKLEKFNELIETSFQFDLLPANIMPILVIIGGYCVRKILNKNKCAKCISWLQLEKTVDVDSTYDFLKDKDRGKLIMPSGIVVYAAGIVWDTMNNLIESYELLGVNQQLHILNKISIIKLERSDHALLLDECLCNLTLLDKLKAVCLTVSKILLNNYVKCINDEQHAFKSPGTSRKIKKLRAS